MGKKKKLQLRRSELLKKLEQNRNKKDFPSRRSFLEQLGGAYNSLWGQNTPNFYQADSGNIPYTRHPNMNLYSGHGTAKPSLYSGSGTVASGGGRNNDSEEENVDINNFSDSTF